MERRRHGRRAARHRGRQAGPPRDDTVAARPGDRQSKPTLTPHGHSERGAPTEARYMASSSYVRLSAQDHSFLMAERRSTPMHVGAIQIYEAGPLRRRDGGIDVATFKRGLESNMHLLPRYRQRLKWIPMENHPVWVDDRQFNLDYHDRHTALPRPAGSEALEQL